MTAFDPGRLTRRQTLAAAAMTAAGAALGTGFPLTAARAQDRFDISTIQRPPLTDRQAFIDYMLAQGRGEEAEMLGWRFDRMQRLVGNGDLWREKEIGAFLLAPRENFCLPQNRDRAYDHAFLGIGYGVTISGPHIVGRMTSGLDLQPGQKVLEIGTGSGYQSAILSYLTDQVYTVEVIEPLAERTRGFYDEMAAGAFPEYANITSRASDGYYGWDEYAPFDAIIVTAAIDHIPPDLLQQLAVGGTMVIPVGPLGAQTLLRVQKTEDASGNISITRDDMYQGRRTVSFVPFTRQGGGTWSQ
ncbi:MAG: protein-L-isoaspartate O-methyltransferase [Rhodospirillaceae bacterium]|nr:protein-L-isoaspartate O-methyltransferase [Rhodospirillaceae bacterium]